MEESSRLILNRETAAQVPASSKSLTTACSSLGARRTTPVSHQKRPDRNTSLLFLFLLATLGGAHALQPILGTRTAFRFAIGYLLFAFVVTTAIQSPDLGGFVPHWILQPFDPNDKTNLAPYRVLHFIALAVVVTRFLPLDSPILQWRALAPMIQCGRKSLQVFCTGIVLSFCAHAAIELSLNALWIQIVVGAIGISLMTAVANSGTRSKGRDRPLASPVRIGELA